MGARTTITSKGQSRQRAASAPKTLPVSFASRPTKKIAVLGLWHLGCVTAACCAKHFQVVGLDFDKENIAKLNSGKAPLFEPGLDELIAAGIASKKLSFTASSEMACTDADISLALLRYAGQRR